MAEPMDVVDDDFSSDNIVDMSDNTLVELVDTNSNVAVLVDESPEVSKFQKESHLLKFLPYYATLEEETCEYLDKLITNIGKAVICRDFQLGLVLYTKSMRTYLYLYGKKFSKDQHIKLIHLYLEILTMDCCPLNIIPEVADLLNTLLKKPELLTKEDLTIPWRPLYDTLDRFVFHRKYTLSFTASAKIEALLKETIRLCNVYFERNTLHEVITEFSPLLCPTASKMVFGLEMLKHFLPFLDPETENDLNKFIEDLLAHMNAWNNHPTWEWTMIGLLATASWNMPGSFDWTPHLPGMYARLMKNLELPVHFKGDKNGPATGSVKSFEYGSAARWIVSTLGNNDVALKHLRNFLKSLETYYNPTNQGRWTMPLGALLNELVNVFTLRLKKERYLNMRKRWWYRVAPEHKLTDQDIEEFVDMTSHLVLDFYLDLNMCGFVMKNLAMIKPSAVIPAVMEKYSAMVETLIEPRKFMITMRWVSVVLLPLVSSRKSEEGYDGRSLVMPFALSLLPAVDPNDMYKTLSALGCLHGLFNFVPFVDCSSLAHTIEDEEERELCLATSCLEDFSLQLVDRIFSLVENRTLENTRMSDSRGQAIGPNNEDVSLEKFLWAVFHRIAVQSSTTICKTLVNKIVKFALGSTLETDVSGKMLASIVQAFAVGRPDVILPKMLPKLCHSVTSMITDDIVDDEELDKTLLYHLLLLSYVVETSGVELLKYRNDVEEMLVSVLKLNGKKAFLFSAHILMRFLHSLVFIYPLESRISEADYDDPNYLAIKDWGVAVDPKTIKMKWHVPNEEEMQWAKDVFLRVFEKFSSELSQIGELTEGSDTLNKRLHKTLRILQAAYDGVSTLLPFWDSKPIVSNDTVVDLSADRCTFDLPKCDITVPHTNENMMKKYFQIFCNVLTYVEKFKSDDTDAFIAILRAFDGLVIPAIESERRLVPAAKGTMYARQHMMDPKKKYTRGGVIVRVYDVHLKRVRSASCTTWTDGHVEIMEKMFQLCVNRYAKVRLNAQTRFCRTIDGFGGFIARAVTKFFFDKLRDGVPHHAYKGALYTMIGTKVSCVLSNSWEEIYKLWTALVQSPFSEKNSVIKIMEKLQTTISQNFIYYPLEQRISEKSNVIAAAKDLLSKSTLADVTTLGPIETPNNIHHYNNLVNTLLDVGTNSNNHWRKQVMCANMLSVLIAEEAPLSKRIVEFFFNSLISHSIDIRQVGINTIVWMLVLFKRRYSTVFLDTKEELRLTEGETIQTFLQYETVNNKAVPKYEIKTKNGPVPNFFVHKTYYGFLSLPRKLKVKTAPKDYGDLSTQPASCKIVLETTRKCFEDAEYVSKLIELWSLEEKGKGHGTKRSNICKLIARNHGPNTLKLLVDTVSPLGTDKDQWKQRCVADVLCGILYGMKLWDDETTQQYWSELKPTFNSCLDSVTQETIDFWAHSLAYPNVNLTSTLRCYPGSIGDLLQTLSTMSVRQSQMQAYGARKRHHALNRDPNKMRFFIEFLKERFIQSLETAQTTSVDAYKDMNFFEIAIGNVQWRGGELYSEILNLVKKYFFDTPIPYMNIRIQLGRLLGGVFEWDIDWPGLQFCPKYEPFVDFLFGNMENLQAEAARFQANEQDSGENGEAKKLLLKFKTVLEWLLSVCWDVEATIPSSVYRFIPLLCSFESFDPDPEIAQLSSVALSGLARSLIHSKDLDCVLSMLCKASSSTSWRARLCVLEFLKVFALNNTSIFASGNGWTHNVTELVLKLLRDRKLEVREAAAKILCGFLHCLLIEEPMKLMNTFRQTASIYSKKYRNAQANKDGGKLSPEQVDQAHSAILGLCSFVDMHPYDVPDYLPDILVVLTTHANDPQPIPATIRKCLSNFRRTHHDNWVIHKTKFSEDQLCILTDIFVSPCYYA